MREPNGKVLAVLLVTFMVFGAGSILGTAYTLRAFCAWLDAESAAAAETPPSTPLGENRVRRLNDLRESVCRV